MPAVATVVEQLAATRAQLEAVCDLLLSPTADAIDRCSILLESASSRMTSFRNDMSEARGDAGAIEEAWKVRRCFLRATKLFENAAKFHANWVAIRGAMTGGYTSSGEPAPVRHPGRVWLEA